MTEWVAAFFKNAFLPLWLLSDQERKGKKEEENVRTGGKLLECNHSTNILGTF
jgi:hypothetical protein